jgi:hypothetical protein
MSGANGMTAKPCKHPRLDKQLRCKSCGLLVDIREKKNKYGAKRTDGFHSAKEARRFKELELQQKAGRIKWLELQEKIPIVVNGKLICTWIADFSYFDPKRGYVREDVKGVRTPVYRLKKKLVEAVCEIQIQEI